MMKPSRPGNFARASRWLWALTLGVSCLLGRSEQSVKSEFNAYVQGANQCQDATECGVAYADCPLGCFVAVRADRKKDVEAKANDLVAEYRRGGQKCVYDCATPGEPICLAGRCAFGNAATGGVGGSANLGGAGGASNSGGGPIRTAVVTLNPADGTTAAAGMDLALVFTDPGSVLDAAAIERVRSAVVLATWPEKAQVPATVTATGTGGPAGATIRVTPGGALSDRWYLLSASAIPTNVVPSALLADGSVGVRFRPTSQPRVRTLQICDKEGAGAKLLLTFSEPITYTAPTAGLIGLAIDDVTSSCDVYQAMEGALYLTCAQLTATSHATISVGAGLQGASGVPLQPTSFDVNVASLTPQSGCRVFTPTIP
jgi:hypothetical protein